MILKLKVITRKCFNIVSLSAHLFLALGQDRRPSLFFHCLLHFVRLLLPARGSCFSWTLWDSILIFIRCRLDNTFIAFSLFSLLSRKCFRCKWYPLPVFQCPALENFWLWSFICLLNFFHYFNSSHVWTFDLEKQFWVFILFLTNSTNFLVLSILYSLTILAFCFWHLSRLNRRFWRRYSLSINAFR